MRMRWIAVLSSTLVVVMPAIASSQAAVVHYERGRRMVRGVQLLQAYSDSNSYYYVPQFPRLSMKDDSTYELLMVKYVGANAATSGGLFHALVEFTFFFSSRRRHTRCGRDWSSDVCSSD